MNAKDRRIPRRLWLVIGLILAGDGITAWWLSRSSLRDKDFINGLGMTMVWCEPGVFIMGATETDPGARSRNPPHEVTLSHGFWIGHWEVTQAQWTRLMGNNRSKFQKQTMLWIFQVPRPRAPVDSISWDEAMDFCRRLTVQERASARLPEGWIYTLPTEAQWEYACRAGTDTAFAFGDTLDQTQANFGSKSTVPCGSYAPNTFGLYDMHGNLFEHCLDIFGRYSAEPVVDPKGKETGNFRSQRGGSWDFTAPNTSDSSSRRGVRRSSAGGENEGMRVVLTKAP